MAEWLRRGLQILLSQFDSGRGLQNLSCFILLKVYSELSNDQKIKFTKSLDTVVNKVAKTG